MQSFESPQITIGDQSLQYNGGDDSEDEMVIEVEKPLLDENESLNSSVDVSQNELVKSRNHFSNAYGLQQDDSLFIGIG